MEFRQITFMLRRWAWLLAAGFLVGLIGGVLVSVMMTPVYEFESKVLISRNQESATAEFPNLNDVQLVQTYVELLTTGQILDRVSEMVGYDVDPDALTVQQLRDTQIIQIAVEDTDVNRGVNIANGMVTVLQQENNRLQEEQYIAAVTSLAEQIAITEAEIEALNAEVSTILTQDIQSQMAEVDAQIASIETEIFELQNSIARMSNPLSIVVQGELAENQARLALLQSLLTQYRGIRTNLLFLGKPDEAATGVTSPRLEQLYSNLEHYESVYLDHLSSMESLQLDRKRNISTITPIQAANIPSNPIRPIPIIYTGLAAIAGTMIAALGIVAIEASDDTIKTPADIQSIRSIPVLGMIRKASSLKSHFINEQDVTKPPMSGVFEDYRSLSVQLMQQHEIYNFKTLMITSCGRSDGTTTTAVNVATIFARSGHQVILLDANLKQPRLHSILGGDSEIQVLDLGHGVREHALATSDLMGVNKIATVLDRTEDWGNRMVIIDAPPVFNTDAKILAPKVDGVLLVIEAWETEKEELRAALQQLEQSDAKVIGISLNSIPIEYGYYYDSYNFLNSESEWKKKSNKEPDRFKKTQMIPDQPKKEKVKKI